MKRTAQIVVSTVALLLGSAAYAQDAFGNQTGFGGKAGTAGTTDPVVLPPQGLSRLTTNNLHSAPLPDERSAARPELVGIGLNGQAYATGLYQEDQATQFAQRQVLGRAGDYVFASLLYGFNSDDVRGLPIYATITDLLQTGDFGPLHGARIEGRVAYSSDNASLTFSRIILSDGRDLPMEGIAVSPDASRTGVAEDVNRHRFRNYSTLFLGGLLEGLGTIAEASIANDSTGDTILVTGDGSVTIESDSSITDRELLYGSLAPIGRNINNEITSQGLRAPTITAPAGYSFGVVLTETLLYDPANQGQGAVNVRTGTFVSTGIEAATGNQVPAGAAPAVDQQAQITDLQRQIQELQANQVAPQPGDLFLQSQQSEPAAPGAQQQGFSN